MEGIGTHKRGICVLYLGVGVGGLQRLEDYNASATEEKRWKEPKRHSRV